MAPNRGVIAPALLLATALAVALPGAGLEAAGAGSEPEPRVVPPDTSPAQTGRLFPLAPTDTSQQYFHQKNGEKAYE